MNMEKFEIELSLPHVKFDSFKKKQMQILKNLLDTCRLMNLMRFSSYGSITYTDKSEKKIVIEECEKYTRSNSYCLIYDVLDTPYDDGRYDKVIIYYSSIKQDYYGFFLYNSNTKKSTHIYCLRYEDDNLAHRIYSALTSSIRKPLFDYYGAKYDWCKGRTDKSMTVTDYNNAIEKISKIKEKCVNFF